MLHVGPRWVHPLWETPPEGGVAWSSVPMGNAPRARVCVCEVDGAESFRVSTALARRVHTLMVNAWLWHLIVPAKHGRQ